MYNIDNEEYCGDSYDLNGSTNDGVTIIEREQPSIINLTLDQYNNILNRLNRLEKRFKVLSDTILSLNNLMRVNNNEKV